MLDQFKRERPELYALVERKLLGRCGAMLRKKKGRV